MTDDPDSSSVTITVPGENGGGVEIDLVYEAGDWSRFEPIAEIVSRACQELARDPALDTPNITACIALSTNEHVRNLNRTYRGKDKPTNVLSFPSAEAIKPASPNFIGDIILALETIELEASETGVTPRDHLAHLVVHGLLHLNGFDHENPTDAEEMESLESAILARLGIADPYAAPLCDEAIQENCDYTPL